MTAEDLPYIISDVLNRGNIHNKIKMRTIRMFERGLIDEVKDIIKKYPNISKCQSMKSIGYKHIIEWFFKDIIHKIFSKN